jgi:hypothetical protein
MESLLLLFVNLMTGLVVVITIIKLIGKEVRRTLDHQDQLRISQIDEIFEQIQKTLRRGSLNSSIWEELGDLRKLYSSLEEAGREAFGYEAEVKEAKDEDEDGYW